jgi:hypothetical protein
MFNILSRKLLLELKKKGKKNRNGLGDASLCLQKLKTPNKTRFASKMILWIQHNINYWNYFSLHGYLIVFFVCMVCEKLKVHFTPTTKFVNQIVKVVAKGEQQFVACHQQL